MAASIGTWTGFTNGSDPSGSATINAGTNRKFVLMVMGETDLSVVPPLSVTVGGQSPSESKSITLEIGVGFADLAIYAFIFDEATIAAMSGSTISYSDGDVWSKISWGYVTVQDTDQGTTDAPTNSSASATSVTCTWSSATDSNGIVVGAIVANSANREPLDTTLTQRMEYSLANYAAEVGDGSGGGTVAASITMSNDGLASALVGMALFFAETTGAVSAFYALQNYGDF